MLAIGLPLLAAALWATFRAPGDASGGEPIVAVRGTVRLVLELSFFAPATWALYDAGQTQWAWILGLVVALHYVASYDRVAWLLRQT